MENKDLKEILGDGESEAKSRLGRLMPERPDKMSDDFEMKTEFSQKDIDAKTKGYKEVAASSHKDKIAKAKSELGAEPNEGSIYDLEGDDDYKYKVLYVNGEWRVYKGEKVENTRTSQIEAKVAEKFDGSYVEVKNPKGEERRALNFAKREIGSDDVYEVLDGNGELLYVYAKNGKLYKAT